MPTENDEQRQSVRKLPLFEGPKLLVLREKHGNRYYFVQNEAHLHAIALHILTERLNEGYWYPAVEDEIGTEVKRKHDELLVERERCGQIQDDDVRRAALKTLNDKIANLKEDVQEKREAQRIRLAIERQDGQLALQVLRDRANCQYEGFELDRLENMTPDDDRSSIPLLPMPNNPAHGQEWVDEHGDRWVYDQKTVEEWIPQIYASLLYNVEAFQGKEIFRKREESEAYARTEKKVTAS